MYVEQTQQVMKRSRITVKLLGEECNKKYSGKGSDTRLAHYIISYVDIVICAMIHTSTALTCLLFRSKIFWFTFSSRRVKRLETFRVF